MKKLKIIFVIIVGFLLFPTVGVFAADNSQTLKPTTITDPKLTQAKAYDGTTKAEVTKGKLSGITEEDDITVNAVATYDSADIGKTKLITVVYTLGGKDAKKYAKPANYTVAAGEITQTPLTIGIPTLKQTKVNDNTTAVTANPGKLKGVIGTEDVTATVIATYDTPENGKNKTITVTCTLGGANAANYINPIDFTVATGEITPASNAATSSTSNGSAPDAISSATTVESVSGGSAPDAVSSATVVEPASDETTPDAVSSATIPVEPVVTSPDAVSSATIPVEPVVTTPVEPVVTVPDVVTGASPVKAAPVVEPTPVVTTPVEPTPVVTTPVEPTPVVTAPVEPTPVVTAPVEPTPVVTTPDVITSATVAA